MTREGGGRPYRLTDIGTKPQGHRGKQCRRIPRKRSTTLALYICLRWVLTHSDLRPATIEIHKRNCSHKTKKTRLCHQYGIRAYGRTATRPVAKRGSPLAVFLCEALGFGSLFSPVKIKQKLAIFVIFQCKIEKKVLYMYSGNCRPQLSCYRVARTALSVNIDVFSVGVLKNHLWIVLKINLNPHPWFFGILWSTCPTPSSTQQGGAGKGTLVYYLDHKNNTSGDDNGVEKLTYPRAYYMVTPLNNN